MNVQSPNKWWATLKSAMFGSSSSLPPLVTESGGLVCDSVGNADLLSDHFDSKQSREAVDLPLICHLYPSFSQTWTLMVTLTNWACFLFFLRELLMFWPLVLV